MTGFWKVIARSLQGLIGRFLYWGKRYLCGIDFGRGTELSVLLMTGLLTKWKRPLDRGKANTGDRKVLLVKLLVSDYLISVANSHFGWQKLKVTVTFRLTHSWLTPRANRISFWNGQIIILLSHQPLHMVQCSSCLSTSCWRADDTWPGKSCLVQREEQIYSLSLLCVM